MKCLNDPTKYYKGDEPSPKGRGYVASAEDLHSRKKGNDGKIWQVKEDKRGVKRWTRVVSEKKKRAPKGILIGQRGRDARQRGRNERAERERREAEERAYEEYYERLQDVDVDRHIIRRDK